jgi:hypothetical protein
MVWTPVIALCQKGSQWREVCSAFGTLIRGPRSEGVTRPTAVYEKATPRVLGAA